jgi:hypothetical protein
VRVLKVQREFISAGSSGGGGKLKFFLNNLSLLNFDQITQTPLERHKRNNFFLKKKKN